MSELILISAAILVILIVIGILTVLLVWKRKKEGKYKEPNYQAFFVMGICFLPMGIVFMITINVGFIGITGMGLVYMIIGLVNRDKWEKNR